MNRRTARLAAALLAGVLGFVLLPIVTLSAPAGADFTETFNLDMVEGELVLRGSDEPYQMTNPTTLSGTNTDGAFSGVSFSTPSVHFEREVVNPPTTAEIDATFSQLSPGVGSINGDGDVTVQLTLAVDLVIVVDILPEPSECRASPINLTLTSTEPYDPNTETVTLSAPNFTVPAVPATPSCALVAGPVNEALAGSGHALTMTMEGPLTIPVPGEPTTTSLSVSPAAGARAGDEVTLTSTVVADPAVPGAPDISGVVSFFDGDTPLGTAPVGAGGTASITTDALLAGPRELRATYSGAPPDWAPSESAVTTYNVLAAPAVTTDAAGYVQAGGDDKAFGVTVTNTGFGEDLDDARLDVSIERTTGFGPIGPVSPGNDRITLNRVVGGVPTAIPLTLSGSTLQGSVGDLDTWLVEPGSSHTETLSLDVAAGVSPGPLRLTFTLVTDDDGTPTTLGSSSGVITILNGDRTPTTITAGDPGFPPFIPEVPPVTPVVRQGNVAEAAILTIGPEFSGVRPTGTLSFAVDGRPVLSRVANASTATPWAASIPASGSDDYLLQVPTDIPIGTRQVTAKYSGDALFAPSQASWPITVEPSIGTFYECLSQGITQGRFMANVEFQGNLPPQSAVGQDIDFDRVEVRLLASRTRAHAELLTSVVQPGADSTLELGLDPNGTVEFAEVSRTDNVAMSPGDGLGIDSIIDLSGGVGSVTVEHAPGTSVPYKVSTITATAITDSGFLGGVVCTPVGEAHSFGSVTSAGTSLTVEPGGTVREGTDVTLTAIALPAAPGVVEFRNGNTTVGVVPVDANGKAVLTTDDLPAGSLSLNARFFGGAVPTGPSPSVPLEVEATDCAPFAVAGNGATVRLVYMTILDECPDQDGFDYWVGRLGSGTSREQFANAISKTPAARGVLVDDAYDMMLERSPEASGRAFWVGRLGTNARYDALIASLAVSPEFWELSGETAEGAVERLYERILGRTATEGDIAYWSQQIDDRGIRAMALSLFNLPEPLGVVVTDAYQELLGRDPSASELATGVALMKGRSNRSALYASIINTSEFHDRAQGFPNFP